MSAPKPELTAELRAVIERRKQRSCWCADCLDDMIREVAEIVARGDAEIAKQPYSDEVAVIHGEEPSVIGKKIGKAILTHWGLK